MTSPQPFDKPIYITRPLLPELPEFVAKLEEIWKSGWLSNGGKMHQQLEAALQEQLKANHLSLFNNGTIALITACQALHLSGEVITTPFTFPATPHVLAWNDITPVFCDIDPVTMNLDAAKIESLITSKTTGILAVHVYGTPCDVAAIQDVADRYGLKVIYDAAHAFGVEIDGKGISGFGDASMFSFHATKLFHTAEGGALAVNEANLKHRIDFLKNFGIKNEEEVVMPGINGKMNEIQAALGLANLNYIEREREKRKLLVETYHACLDGMPGISFHKLSNNIRNSYQYFVIRIDEGRFGRSRDFVHEKLKEFNVFSRKYFYPLCSNYSCYRQLPSAQASNLPVATQVVKECLAMPLYGELSTQDVGRIAEMLKSCAR